MNLDQNTENPASINITFYDSSYFTTSEKVSERCQRHSLAFDMCLKHFARVLTFLLCFGIDCAYLFF